MCFNVYNHKEALLPMYHILKSEARLNKAGVKSLYICLMRLQCPLSLELEKSQKLKIYFFCFFEEGCGAEAIAVVTKPSAQRLYASPSRSSLSFNFMSFTATG